MKKTLVCLAIVLPLTLHLRAASIWTDTGAEIDERVSDTQTLAPVNLMQPALAQVPFSNFRYPHVDAQIDVTFIADDPVYGGSAHHGVFRSVAKTGELVPLMRKGDPVPGMASARFTWFRGLQVDGTDFVINANDSEHGRGLYHYSNGNVTLLARTGTTLLPGVGRPLTLIEYGALSHGRVLYNAMAGKENLLVLHDLKSGQATVICRTGTPIPGKAGETFGYFSHQNWLDGSNIVFRAAVGDPESDNGSNLRGVYGWFGINWSKAGKELDPSRLVAIADSKMAVPSLEKGTFFNDFRSAPIRDGLIGFVAGGPNSSGVYYCSVAAKPGSLHPIVDTETSLKGLFEGNFTSFEIWCSVFDKSVVFVGHAGNGYAGVFLYRADKDELFLLTDNRQPLEGKQVANFEIAGDFLTNNRFAVTAHYKDKTSGVYLATIPKHAFKRMAAATASN